MERKVFPYSDFFARFLLGDESNSDILLSFINSVNEDYNLPLITSISIKNPFNLKALDNEKESIIDIKACDESGKQYDIEIQVTGNELFKHRSLYYWANLYVSQIKSGMDYQVLKPTICINLINFNLIENMENVHTCFLIKELKNPQLILTDHLVIHYLELKKFLKRTNFSSQLEKWMAFFKYEGWEEEIMETVIKDDVLLRKAHEKYTQFTHNDELMELYEARLKWQLQYNTDIEFAREQGIEQGIEQSVVGFYREGITVPVIMKSLKLEEKTVMGILKKQGLL